MATQTYVNGVTLSDAAEFNKFDTAAYPVLTGVAGTNTVTATGPANYSLSSATPALVLTPAVTNTSSVTLAITPSGGAALTAKNVFSGGSALVGGELVAGVDYLIHYDGTQYNIIGGPAVTRGTTSTTFTFNGSGGTSGAVTVTWQKIGQWVTINIPAVTATSGTSSTDFTSDTGIAAAARPAATQYSVGVPILNNNTTTTDAGRVSISSSGILVIKRDSSNTAFTNSSTCGTLVPFSFTYFVG